MSIIYSDSVESLSAEQLQGFFVGWPNPPTAETHLRILKQSAEVVIAVDKDSAKVVGFINAISDKLLSAYLPLLEVLPDYQHCGIGSELVRRMMEKLTGLYMIDLVCDPKLESFYRQFGLGPAQAMVIRNFDNQAGGL